MLKKKRAVAGAREGRKELIPGSKEGRKRHAPRRLGAALTDHRRRGLRASIRRKKKEKKEIRSVASTRGEPRRRQSRSWQEKKYRRIKRFRVTIDLIDKGKKREERLHLSI